MTLALGNPAWLAAAPVIAALLALAHTVGFRRLYLRRAALWNPMARVVKLRRRPRRRLTLALKLAFAAAVSLALAQPHLLVEREVEAAGQARARMRLAQPVAVLVIDVSGSMGESVPGGVKIEVAKEALKMLVERAPPSVHLGLVAFSDRIVHAVPPTSDRRPLLSTIELLKPEGGTMYTFAFQTALSWVRPYVALGAPALVVFASDGLPADPEYRDLLSEFRGLNVSVHAVFIGSEKEGEAEMELIARETGGEHYTAANAQEILEVFARLAEKVAELNVTAGVRTRVKVSEEVDLAWAPAAVAAVTLALLLAARYRAARVTF